MARTDLESPASQRYSSEPQEESAWAAGLLLFAAMLMVVIGMFHFFAGLAGVITNDFLVIEDDGYAYEIDVTLWGIAHIILGGVITVAGGLLMSGKTWALYVALVLAALSAVGSFLSIPNDPAWSITIIALDIGIIWAITTELKQSRRPSAF